MRIVEHFTAARTPGRTNEDRLVVTPAIVAVVDGAGDPPGREWRGKSPGWHAARVIEDALTALDPDSPPRAAVNEINVALQSLIAEMAPDGLGPPNPAANMVAFSQRQHVVWRVGDCAFRIDDVVHDKAPKAFEQALIDTRRLVLLAGLADGRSQSELDSDVRAIYEVLYRYQEACQNSPRRHAFTFGVLDGRDVDDSDIEVFPVHERARELVLVSDGYPVILPTLEESEKALAEILSADPLLLGRLAQTQAVAAGGGSYDDRTFVRIFLHES